MCAQALMKVVEPQRPVHNTNTFMEFPVLGLESNFSRLNGLAPGDSFFQAREIDDCSGGFRALYFKTQSMATLGLQDFSQADVCSLVDG